MNNQQLIKQKRTGNEGALEYRNINYLFKQMRLDKGLTVSDLAKKINYSKDTLKKIESAERNPSLGIIRAYHNEFHLSYDFLIDGKESKHTLEQLKEQIAELPISDLKELMKFMPDLIPDQS